MKDLLTYLEGKKTYIVVALGIIYLFGGDQGWWTLNESILGMLGFGGLATLRSGVTRGNSPPPPKPQ